MIDAHAHLAPGKADALLSTMDRLGIDQAVVVAGGSVDPRTLAEQIENPGGGIDIDIDNASVFEQCERSGFRLLPFYFANPHRGDEVYAREGNVFDGLKLGPAVHGVSFEDPRTHELVARAESFGHSVYLHCLAHPGFKVVDFVRLAMKFSRVRFILGHAGVGNCDFGALDHIAGLTNVSFEMSGGFSSVCRAAVRKLGAGRVLFGTEYPLQDPRVEIAKLMTLDLSREDLVCVTRTNILHLLQRQRQSSCAA